MSDLSVRPGGLGVTTIYSRSYATLFPETENPLSQSGRWINGGSVGLDWKDCRCTPGLAFGAGTTSPPPYDDPTAVLSGTWGRTQVVEGTIVVPASPTGDQEVELRVLTKIVAHSILGYEVLFSVTSNPYIAIMRWDGGTDLEDFVQLAVTTGPQLVTGNRIKATITEEGLISAYLDTGGGFVLRLQATDTTYTAGAPGIGFFNVGAGSPSDFGFSAFLAKTI